MPASVPRRRTRWTPLPLLFLAAACGRPAGDAPDSPKVALRFVDVAEEAGIRFRHQAGADVPKNLLMTMGSGCALFDYDGDGWLDAFLVNGHALDPADDGAPGLPALYRNRRDGTFEEVTEAAGLARSTFGQGCAVADFDGDGWPDLYVTNFGPNLLWRNRGDGTFEDVTERSGTGDERWSTGAVFLDHDGDGDLDLYVANYASWPEDLELWGLRKFKGPRFYEDADDAFLRNEGDGTFTDVTAEVGLEPGGKGLTAMASDFDGDGDQDVFVANDRTANHLYENLGGTFRSVASQAGVAFDANGVETAGMGVDIVDLDGDGRPDIHLTNFRNEFNNLYRNAGSLSFLDVTKALRLDQNTWIQTGWATRFVDLDNDGDRDGFVANGGIWDQPESPDATITYEQPNCLFLRGEDGRFEEVGAHCGPDFARELVSRGAALGDYDRDGDVDILVLNSSGPAQLFRNETPVGDRWFTVRVRGRAPNTDALGAKVVIRVGERTLHEEVRWPATYLSVCDPTIHVGLAPDETGGSVEVTWPSGRRAQATAAPGERLELLEPES